MACDSISISGLYDCNSLPQGGAKARLILINFEELGSVVFNSNDVITNITMATNRCAYLFEGARDSLVKSEELIVPDSKISVFRHKIDFRVYDITQLQKNNLQNMSRGKYIAITENTQKNAQSFEIHGLNAGLVLAPGSLRASNANNGIWTLSLQSAEGQEEIKLPQTIFATDWATTSTLVTGLTFPPTITNLSVTNILVAGGTTVTVTGTNYFGGVGSGQIIGSAWINQVTGARVTQPLSSATNTTINFTSAAVAAGFYRFEVTTTRGVATSTAVISAP